MRRLRARPKWEVILARVLRAWMLSLFVARPCEKYATEDAQMRRRRRAHRHVEEPSAENDSDTFRSRIQQKGFFIQALKCQSGQAAIEFIAVVIVLFFFLFFYLSLAIVLTVSEYMDYATFMAARTYKSGYSSEEFQQRYARDFVFKKYTDKISPDIARNFRLEFTALDPNDEQTRGVVATYDMDLFYMPPLFITGDDQPVSRITLQSEAFLGRDPAFQDCIGYFEQFSGRLGLNLGGLLGLMDDNGC